MRNLSDGKTNGIVLFYAKDGELYPIGLTQKQMESIDIMIGAAVGNSKLTVLSDKPMGKVTLLQENLEKKVEIEERMI